MKRDELVEANDLIEHLRDKLAVAEAALKTKWTLDVDSPLFDGLVGFGVDGAVIDQGKLLATICAVKAERDEALEKLEDRNSAIKHLQSAIERSSETHQKIVLAYMLDRDEAREAARFVYRFGRCDNAMKLYPWLLEE